MTGMVQSAGRVMSAAKQAAGIAVALLKTGQTTQYGGYEDDGYFEKGTAKSYTINTTGDQSGTTNITLNAKTDVHSNNTVTDDNTGLEWSRYLFASVGPGSDGKLPWITNGDGEGIFTYKDAANAGNLGGHNDWRVPNLYESLSIYNFELSSPHPDSTAFPSWTNDYIWTSTAYTYSINTKYAIRGLINTISGRSDATNYVCILVRGGD